jgi:hypothetical protein
MVDFRKPNLLWTAVILLAVAVLSAGCLSGGVNAVDNNDKWAPPFDGLQWGMSETDVMNALGLSEDDIDNYEYSFVLKNEYELFGVSKKVAFGFLVLEGERFLTSVSIIYDEADLDAVQEEIIKKLGEGEYSYYFGESFLDKKLSCVEWKSELIQDNPDNLKVMTDVVNSYPSEVQDMYLERWPEQPLALYQLDLDQSSRRYGQLTISGFFTFMIDNPERFKEFYKSRSL